MHTLLTLEVDGARLLLAPDIGGAIAGWTRDGTPLMRPMLPDALTVREARSLSSYPLFPYSNRVAGRRFRFAGRTHELPDLMNGHAIHGAGWQVPWAAIQDGPTATIMLDHPAGPLWPFAFHAEQRFVLTRDALQCELLIENRHDHAAPFGFGLHPYFPRGADTTLTFSASHVWHNGAADMIPTHRSIVPPAWDHAGGVPVGRVTLDHCFGGWGGRARLSYPDRHYALDITADPVFAHLVVYIPEGQDYLAVEPVSNMNDGLNRLDIESDHGVFVLAPGEQKIADMRFSVTDL
jgi:aldose 1-epimerase